MIEELKFLFELLQRLLGNRNLRRKEVFAGLISPIYDSFLEIHLKYHDLFSKTIEEFPILINETHWQTQNGSLHNLDDPDIKSQIQDITTSFLANRKKDLAIRDLLRNNATHMPFLSEDQDRGR